MKKDSSISDRYILKDQLRITMDLFIEQFEITFRDFIGEENITDDEILKTITSEHENEYKRLVRFRKFIMEVFKIENSK